VHFAVPLPPLELWEGSTENATSLIEVRDRERLITARMAVTVTRSESSLLVPGAVGVIAGGLGFLLFYWTKRFARYELAISRRLVATAIVIACVAGAIGAICRHHVRRRRHRPHPQKALTPIDIYRIGTSQPGSIWGTPISSIRSRRAATASEMFGTPSRTRANQPS
jgi:hypothetical protein